VFMSISLELKASARSAYRQLLRTSASTFYGDEPILRAFRSKMRADVLAAQSETDPTAYEQHATLAREVATVLRRNIVQARRIDGNGEERWRLRITKDTELGSNDSIKYPAVVEPSSHASRKEKQAQIESSI